MNTATLPRVILVDLDHTSALAAAVEQVTRSCCQLVRATELSSRAAPRPGTDAADDLSTWKSHDVVAAILCVPAADARTEPRIALRLSRLRGFLTLLVAETVDVDVVARLLSSGVSDYVMTSGGRRTSFCDCSVCSARCRGAPRAPRRGRNKGHRSA